MVPEIEIFRTYNFRTLIILVWMRIMGRKKTPSSQIPWRIRKNLQFWKILDFEGVLPYTSWSISVTSFRRYLPTDSTQVTQNFTIGVIFNAESDDIDIFRKFENITIFWNKVRVQPISDSPFRSKTSKILIRVNSWIFVNLEYPKIHPYYDLCDFDL